MKSSLILFILTITVWLAAPPRAIAGGGGDAAVALETACDEQCDGDNICKLEDKETIKECKDECFNFCDSGVEPDDARCREGRKDQYCKEQVTLAVPAKVVPTKVVPTKVVINPEICERDFSAELSLEDQCRLGCVGCMGCVDEEKEKVFCIDLCKENLRHFPDEILTVEKFLDELNVLVQRAGVCDLAGAKEGPDAGGACSEVALGKAAAIAISDGNMKPCCSYVCECDGCNERKGKVIERVRAERRLAARGFGDKVGEAVPDRCVETCMAYVDNQGFAECSELVVARLDVLVEDKLCPNERRRDPPKPERRPPERVDCEELLEASGGQATPLYDCCVKNHGDLRAIMALENCVENGALAEVASACNQFVSIVAGNDVVLSGQMSACCQYVNVVDSVINAENGIQNCTNMITLMNAPVPPVIVINESAPLPAIVPFSEQVKGLSPAEIAGDDAAVLAGATKVVVEGGCAQAFKITPGSQKVAMLLDPGALLAAGHVAAELSVVQVAGLAPENTVSLSTSGAGSVGGPIIDVAVKPATSALSGMTSEGEALIFAELVSGNSPVILELHFDVNSAAAPIMQQYKMVGQTTDGSTFECSAPSFLLASFSTESSGTTDEETGSKAESGGCSLIR